VLLPRRLARLSIAGVPLAAVVLAAFLTISSSGSGPMVESAAAAVRKAAAVSAASAERSGTAVVRITQGGQPWAGREIRWNGSDLAFADDTARAGERPRETRVVDGTLYAQDEHLATVREDVGGGTLRRITKAMTGLTTTHLDDGSTVYRGTVAAGVIADETGFNEGQTIRCFRSASSPTTRRPIRPRPSTRPSRSARTASSATSPSRGERGPTAWACMVAYRDLGSTPSPTAPPDARPLRDRARAAQQP